MNWDRSETIGLAKQFCKTCDGAGLKPKTKGRPTPCNCVLRAIFRACYARFRRCVSREKFMSKVSMIPCAGKENKMTFARLDEEYVADFCLVSRRSLDPFDYEVFRNHFLLGADWRLCCRKTGMDKGAFFHSVYRIQQKLGRAFCETYPYPLYPVRDYFTIYTNHRNPAVMPSRRPEGSALHEVVPVRKAA